MWVRMRTVHLVKPTDLIVGAPNTLNGTDVVGKINASSHIAPVQVMIST